MLLFRTWETWYVESAVFTTFPGRFRAAATRRKDQIYLVAKIITSWTRLIDLDKYLMKNAENSVSDLRDAVAARNFGDRKSCLVVHARLLSWWDFASEYFCLGREGIGEERVEISLTPPHAGFALARKNSLVPANPASYVDYVHAKLALATILMLGLNYVLLIPNKGVQSRFRGRKKFKLLSGLKSTLYTVHTSYLPRSSWRVYTFNTLSRPFLKSTFIPSRRKLMCLKEIWLSVLSPSRIEPSHRPPNPRYNALTEMNSRVSVSRNFSFSKNIASTVLF